MMGRQYLEGLTHAYPDGSIWGSVAVMRTQQQP
jgi:hypothetical protein